MITEVPGPCIWYLYEGLLATTLKIVNLTLYEVDDGSADERSGV